MSGQKDWHEYAGVTASVILGGAIFAFVVGISVLDPTNIQWLDHRDGPAYYLGAAYFINGPWELPPGANSDYGLELSTSVYFSDAIPLLAIFFKTFRGLLPEPFQYFGLWLLLCFVLQSLLAYKIFRALELSPLVSVLGACLLTVSPPMLWRLLGHYSLVGHWIILLALYFYLLPPTRSWLKWPPLIAVGAALHSYFLVMVLSIWAADLGRRCLKREATLWSLGSECVLAFSGALGALWVGGFFELSSGHTGAHWLYSHFRMNTLSLFDSQGWSRFIPQLTDRNDGCYEGFNYLGLGFIVFSVFSLPAIFCGKAKVLFSRRWVPLLIVFVALFAFAVTNNIGISRTNFQFELPEQLWRVFSVVRASGRLFWPVYYGIVIGIIWLVYQTFGTRKTAVLMTAALVIQLLDFKPMHEEIFDRVASKHGKTWPEHELASPFWDRAGDTYGQLRVLPGAYSPPDWPALGYFALTHGMKTNVVHFARDDHQKVALGQALQQRWLEEGSFEEDTIYLIDQSLLDQVRAHYRDGDLLAEIDDYVVFARHGAPIAQELGISQLVSPDTPALAETAPGQSPGGLTR